MALALSGAAPTQRLSETATTAPRATTPRTPLDLVAAATTRTLLPRPLVLPPPLLQP